MNLGPKPGPGEHGTVGGGVGRLHGDSAHPRVKSSTVSVTLDAAPAAAGLARQLLADACRSAALPAHLSEDAVLLISELVTNVVIHGGAQARVSVTTDDGGVRVDVSDDGRGRPQIPAPDPLAEHGRGLLLLEACATCWGVHDNHPGKTVWFELHTSTRPTLRLVH